jgi:hypothetical protein
MRTRSIVSRRVALLVAVAAALLLGWVLLVGRLFTASAGEVGIPALPTPSATSRVTPTPRPVDLPAVARATGAAQPVDATAKPTTPATTPPATAATPRPAARPTTSPPTVAPTPTPTAPQPTAVPSPR